MRELSSVPREGWLAAAMKSEGAVWVFLFPGCCIEAVVGTAVSNPPFWCGDGLHAHFTWRRPEGRLSREVVLMDQPIPAGVVEACGGWLVSEGLQGEEAARGLGRALAEARR